MTSRPRSPASSAALANRCFAPRPRRWNDNLPRAWRRLLTGQINKHDPEKWLPASRLREASPFITPFIRSFGGRRQVGKDHAPNGVVTREGYSVSFVAGFSARVLATAPAL